MSKELQVLQEEIVALKTHNNEVMAIVNSDTPLTHKIKSLLEQPKIRAEFLALLPDVSNREQILKSETQSMIFDIMQSPELQQCTPQSFLFSLKDALARGLRIGSAHKEAWLVKFSNKKKGADGKEVWVNEAKIMLGWRSYVNRAWNENKTRLNAGTITYDEVQYIEEWKQNEGILKINIPIGKESRLHTKENISYVYVTAKYPDGTTWSQMYTTDAIEEKSKTGKWDGKGDSKTKVYSLGKVWNSGDRLTDYKEMLHKGAVILFSKFEPSRGLAELADFDHHQLEQLQDITPPTRAITDQATAINSLIQNQTTSDDSESYNPETGEIIDDAPTESAPLADRVNSMIAAIAMDQEQFGTADYQNIIETEGFKALWQEVKASGDKMLLGKISEAMGAK